MPRPIASSGTSKPTCSMRGWERETSRSRLPIHASLILSVAIGTQVHSTFAWATEVPKKGTCPECIGVLNGYLNSCPEEFESCASTQNDDEAHFVAPWEYEGTSEEAKQKLMDVVSKQDRVQMYGQLPSSASRARVASWILKTTGSVMVGRAPPERPIMELQKRASTLDDFVGEIVENEDDYLHVVFKGKGDKRDLVYDAEFLFLKDDSIVDTRISLRPGTDEGKGRLQASLTRGLYVDHNGAKLLLDEIRKTLRWQPAPVITGFDPGWNDKQKLWFEDAFETAQDPSKLFKGDHSNIQDELLSGDPYF